MTSIKTELINIYDRTLKNCKYYERENKPASLNNEIGVLRGVAYCMEVCGLCVHGDDDFLHFISKQERDN